MGDTGGPEFQFLGAHGDYRQKRMAFGCTKYAMVVLPVRSGAGGGASWKRRTATGPGVTECYRSGIKTDRVQTIHAPDGRCAVDGNRIVSIPSNGRKEHRV
ncbi:hypothetical protein D3C81_1825180 [compost metagenome]